MIEGGGWVGVGDERTRVQAGEAVVWPPDVLHAAWTDGAPMRAIVVEFTEPPRSLGPGVVVADVRAVSRGEGRLSPRAVDAAHPARDPDDVDGEPL